MPPSAMPFKAINIRREGKIIFRMLTMLLFLAGQIAFADELEILKQSKEQYCTVTLEAERAEKLELSTEDVKGRVNCRNKVSLAPRKIAAQISKCWDGKCVMEIVFPADTAIPEDGYSCRLQLVDYKTKGEFACFGGKQEYYKISRNSGQCHSIGFFSNLGGSVYGQLVIPRLVNGSGECKEGDPLVVPFTQGGSHQELTQDQWAAIETCGGAFWPEEPQYREVQISKGKQFNCSDQGDEDGVKFSPVRVFSREPLSLTIDIASDCSRDGNAFSPPVPAWYKANWDSSREEPRIIFDPVHARLIFDEPLPNASFGIRFTQQGDSPNPRQFKAIITKAESQHTCRLELEKKVTSLTPMLPSRTPGGKAIQVKLLLSAQAVDCSEEPSFTEKQPAPMKDVPPGAGRSVTIARQDLRIVGASPEVTCDKEKQFFKMNIDKSLGSGDIAHALQLASWSYFIPEGGCKSEGDKAQSFTCNIQNRPDLKFSMVADPGNRLLATPGSAWKPILYPDGGEPFMGLDDGVHVTTSRESLQPLSFVRSGTQSTTARSYVKFSVYIPGYVPAGSLSPIFTRVSPTDELLILSKQTIVGGEQAAGMLNVGRAERDPLFWMLLGYGCLNSRWEMAHGLRYNPDGCRLNGPGFEQPVAVLKTLYSTAAGGSKLAFLTENSLRRLLEELSNRLSEVEAGDWETQRAIQWGTVTTETKDGSRTDHAQEDQQSREASMALAQLHHLQGAIQLRLAMAEQDAAHRCEHFELAARHLDVASRIANGFKDWPALAALELRLASLRATVGGTRETVDVKWLENTIDDIKRKDFWRTPAFGLLREAATDGDLKTLQDVVTDGNQDQLVVCQKGEVKKVEHRVVQKAQTTLSPGRESAPAVCAPNCVTPRK